MQKKMEEEAYIARFFEDSVLRSKLSRHQQNPLLKDGPIASDHREKGNALFRKGRYGEAACQYSDCVLSADCAETLSGGLANRSAALHHLQLYQDCLRDIDAALTAGYAAERRHKLHVRRARCHLAAGRRPEAAAALADYRAAVQALDISGTSREKLLRAVEDLERELQRSAEAVTDPELPQPAKPTLAGSNPALSGASSALQLRQSAGKGRHVVACRTLEAGSLLFVEPPYVSVLLPDRRLDHCHHCLTQTRALLPCSRCRDVGFCSPACREQATLQYHAAECGQARFLESFGIGRAAVRVVLTAGLQPLLQLRQRLAAGEVTAECTGSDCGCLAAGRDRYLAVWHLQRHLPETEEDAYHYSRAAATLAVFLAERTSFFGASPPGDVQLRWVAALLLRHILQLVCNAHAPTRLMQVPTEGSVLQLREERVATALYPAASMMNHSCDPTIINSFWDGILIVKSVKSVEKGEEVFHCYGPHYGRAGPEQRRRELLEQYRFLCECRHCTDPQLRLHLDRLDSLRCLRCGEATLPCDGAGGRTRQCTGCKHRDNYLVQLTQLQDLEQTLAAVDSGREAPGAERLQQLSAAAAAVLSPQHSVLAWLDDVAARLAAERGDSEAALQSLRRNWDRAQARYGTASVEVGNHLLTLTDVLMSSWLTAAADRRRSSALAAELKSACQRGLVIFSVHYGPWSTAYRDLEKKLRRLTVPGARS